MNILKYLLVTASLPILFLLHDEVRAHAEHAKTDCGTAGPLIVEIIVDMESRTFFVSEEFNREGWRCDWNRLFPLGYYGKVTDVVAHALDQEGKRHELTPVVRKGIGEPLSIHLPIRDLQDSYHTVRIGYRVEDGFKNWIGKYQLYWGITQLDDRLPMQQISLTIKMKDGYGYVHRLLFEKDTSYVSRFEVQGEETETLTASLRLHPETRTIHQSIMVSDVPPIKPTPEPPMKPTPEPKQESDNNSSTFLDVFLGVFIAKLFYDFFWRR